MMIHLDHVAPASLKLALVVDDEILIAMTIADHCRDLGLPALEATTSAQALALLDRHPDIDALITDVRMPGLSGPELARIALSHRPGIAVVFVTGYAGEPGLIDPTERWPVLYKPFDLDQLTPALIEAAQRR